MDAGGGGVGGCVGFYCVGSLMDPDIVARACPSQRVKGQDSANELFLYN